MVPVLRVGGQADLSVFCGLLISQVGEIAGDGVVRLSRFADQVQRNGGKLPGGPGLEEEDAIVFRHSHQPAQLVLGLLEDVHKYLGSMAHLHHGHTGAPVVGDFGPGTLQCGKREHGGAGGKVVNALVAHREEPLSVNIGYQPAAPAAGIILL